MFDPFEKGYLGMNASGLTSRAATCLRQLTPPIGGFLGVFQNLKPPGLKAATRQQIPYICNLPDSYLTKLIKLK